MNPFENELILGLIERMEENLEKIRKSLQLLNNEEVWWKPNANVNSIGNQLIHLSGNIRQYVIATLGDTPDIRQRDEEFRINEGLTKEELFRLLDEVVQVAIRQMKTIPKENMLKVYSVQAYQMSTVRILIHVVEHFSYHTGQIALMTKLIKNVDLGFYAGVDLNKKHNY